MVGLILSLSLLVLPLSWSGALAAEPGFAADNLIRERLAARRFGVTNIAPDAMDNSLLVDTQQTKARLPDFDELRRRLFYLGPLPDEDKLAVVNQPAVELQPPAVTGDTHDGDDSLLERTLPREPSKASSAKPTRPEHEGRRRDPSAATEGVSRRFQNGHVGHPALAVQREDAEGDHDVLAPADLDEGSSSFDLRSRDPEHYEFRFKTDDGTERAERADLKGRKVSGKYSWTSPEGDVYRVEYVADASGFRSTGAQLKSRASGGSVQRR